MQFCQCPPTPSSNNLRNADKAGVLIDMDKDNSADTAFDLDKVDPQLVVVMHLPVVTFVWLVLRIDIG